MLLSVIPSVRLVSERADLHRLHEHEVALDVHVKPMGEVVSRRQRLWRPKIEQVPGSAWFLVMMVVLVQVKERDKNPILVGKCLISSVAVMLHRATGIMVV